MKYFVSLVCGFIALFVFVSNANASGMTKPTYKFTNEVRPVKLDYPHHETQFDKLTIENETTPLLIQKPSTDAADIALDLAIGKRYVWGGNSDTEVDCSAFTQQFMRQYKNIEISRTTYLQVKEGVKVKYPEPGDLVFFNDYAHVGVYVGEGMMVDALNPEEGVGLRAVAYVYGTVDGYYRY